jgi:predicted ester cyclase
MQTNSSENKAIVEWLIEELFNRRRTEIARSLYAPECRGNTPNGSFTSRAEFLATFARYTTAFPNFRIEIDYLAAEADRVVVHYTFSGANTGSWAGLPPTGLTVTLGGVMISRIVQQRIVQQDFVWDTFSAQRELWSTPGWSASPALFCAA